MKKINILLVDDSPIERARLKALLENQGHQVLLAADGVEALEIFDATQPDLVILDVMMPVMDGLETARRMRARSVPWVPIIFVSGNTDPEDLAAGIQAGGDDYLNKPVDAVVLGAKLIAMQRIWDMKSLMTQVDAGPFREHIAQVVEVDAAIGIATESAGRRTLTREFSRCSRSLQPVSMLFVTVDQYADIVRTHGEEVAVECLKKTVAALQSNASRIADFVWRNDASTLCVVMPDTPMTGAMRVAERVRRTIRQLDFLADGSGGLTFSISAGVATALPKKRSDSRYLLEAARRMLQRAVQDGGDRIGAVAADMPFHLTARELECLQWSAVGKSSREIATILGISEAAVNFHMANIRHKFNVSSRRQAVAQAIHYGLIRST